MAIREFGESLLADVRARKDQQVSDQRKEDRKEERRELIGAAAVWAGEGLFGLVNNNMEAKTKDYLTKSEYGNTNTLLNKGANLFEEAYGYESRAKTAKTGIYEVVLKEMADASTVQQNLNMPFLVKEGESRVATSYFMQDPELQKLAKERTAYYKKAIELRTGYNRGKTNTPLLEFVKEARPPGWTQSLYNKITGNAVSGDRFNTEMAALEQVVAAKSVVALQAEAVKNNVLAGNVSAINARKLIPNAEIYLNDPGVIAGLKRGEVIKVLASGINFEYKDNAIYRETVVETTQLNGNISVDPRLVKVMDIDEELTPELLVQLTGVHETLIGTAKGMLNNDGFADFNTMLASDFQASGKKVMDQEFISLMFTRLAALDFTNLQNVSKRISPEDVAAHIKTYDKKVISLNAELVLATSRLAAQKKNATVDGVLDKTNRSYKAAVTNFAAINKRFLDLRVMLDDMVGGTGLSEIADPLSDVSWAVDKNLKYEANSKGTVSYMYNEVTRQRLAIQTRKDKDGNITYYLEDPSGKEQDVTTYIDSLKPSNDVMGQTLMPEGSFDNLTPYDERIYE
tara:strand:+ start:1323 stop:3035 length:1713 start_codon:yes stop_codon:yes gene_type:complete